MNIAMKNLTSHFTKKPSMLFLVDSLGAAATTFFLFVVLRNYQDYFGMPKYILTNLSIVVLIFCVYSAPCYFLLKGNWTPYIRAISIANLIYCAFTLMLLYFHFSELTNLGVAYFFIEIGIIITLVYVELSVANAVKKLR